MAGRRVLATGRAQEIDVHLLPWEGEPLVAHRTVVYGVDVASASSVEPHWT